MTLGRVTQPGDESPERVPCEIVSPQQSLEHVGHRHEWRCQLTLRMSGGVPRPAPPAAGRTCCWEALAGAAISGLGRPLKQLQPYEAEIGPRGRLELEMWVHAAYLAPAEEL